MSGLRNPVTQLRGPCELRARVWKVPRQSQPETCPTGVVREVCPVPCKLDEITKHREGRKGIQVRNAARAKRGGCPDSSVAPGGRRQGRKLGEEVQAGHEVDIQLVEAIRGSARKIAGLHLENRDELLIEMLESGVPGIWQQVVCPRTLP